MATQHIFLDRNDALQYRETLLGLGISEHCLDVAARDPERHVQVVRCGDRHEVVLFGTLISWHAGEGGGERAVAHAGDVRRRLEATAEVSR